MAETAKAASVVPGWMKVTLVASLALNIAVIGLIGGLALRGPLGEARPGFAPGDGLIRMHQALPDNKRRELGRAFFHRRDEMRGTRAEMEQLRQELQTLLVSEPFDMDAVRENLATQSDLLGAVGREALELLTGTIAGLTPEERRIFAENLRQARGRPPRERPER